MAHNQGHAKVTARHGKGHSGKKQGIDHIRIHPAQNGFTSQVHRKPAAPSQANPYPSGQEDPVTVHPSADHLVDHIRSMATEMSPEDRGNGDADGDEAGGGGE